MMAGMSAVPRTLPMIQAPGDVRAKAAFGNEYGGDYANGPECMREIDITPGLLAMQILHKRRCQSFDDAFADSGQHESH